MAATREPAEVAPGTVSFELERFERSDGRLELRGRWYGVRGVRFIRPTLRLRSAAGSSRALADLEHKPWMPDDGESWKAAFPCKEEIEVLDAELAVTTGIVIPLPAPGVDQGDAGLIAALPRREPTRAKPADGRDKAGGAREPAPLTPPPARGAKPAPRKTGGARRESDELPKELAALRDETDRLRAEPVRLQGELDQSEQLRKDVEGELERLKLDADGAVARRDAAVGRYETSPPSVTLRCTLATRRPPNATRRAVSCGRAWPSVAALLLNVTALSLSGTAPMPSATPRSQAVSRRPPNVTGRSPSAIGRRPSATTRSPSATPLSPSATEPAHSASPPSPHVAHRPRRGACRARWPCPKVTRA